MSAAGRGRRRCGEVVKAVEKARSDERLAFIPVVCKAATVV